MRKTDPKTQFAVCIKNDDYPASLEIRKIYQVIQDIKATNHKLIRVIDESDEDYLYSEDYFIIIDLPKAVIEALTFKVEY